MPVAHAGAAVRDGDLIFHQSRSAQSLAVQRATGSPYSHMGIVLYRQGKPYVFEASSTVRYTPLAQWIARGERGAYALKRLRAPPDAAALERLKSEADTLTGKPYDPTFEWSDRRMYCSELVWKMYRNATGLQIGRLQRLGDFKLDDPAVKDKLRERYGQRVPRQEQVISPKAMFDSPLLIDVAR